ncbi:MAG: hypothetical protein ACTHMS_24310 [Jatrophihabitans sp.]|uniref:8-oxoguanine DNA glycosylase OGG fold protein n=1 Tax=Jatrophihabitans sp. TaxID=1932789 RepID=UPI003F81677D
MTASDVTVAPEDVDLWDQLDDGARPGGERLVVIASLPFALVVAQPGDQDAAVEVVLFRDDGAQGWNWYADNGDAIGAAQPDEGSAPGWAYGRCEPGAEVQLSYGDHRPVVRGNSLGWWAFVDDTGQWEDIPDVVPTDTPAAVTRSSRTDLTRIDVPPACRTWVANADPAKWIFGHEVTVDLDWWNKELAERQLAGAPLAADDGRTTGQAAISRRRLFALGERAQDDAGASLALLWHSLAWGSGLGRRNNLRRLNAVAADPGGAGQALLQAASLVRQDPVEAYNFLAPDGRPRIRGLGPAFFTKYLYFAAGADLHPLSLILDARVARSLIAAGWTSMHARGGWPSTTYGRYLELIERWHEQLEAGGVHVRADLIERWLFDQGAK